MRVVGGSAGGIPLQIPRTDLRPTMDRVRGAIFSSLGDAVPDAAVLDLFAGCGALGIEALSRGAASAVFVEKNIRACESIKANLKSTRLHGSVINLDVFSYLNKPVSGRFDLIFADPPYTKKADDTDFTAALLEHTGLHALLNPHGIFILESATAGKLLPHAGWEVIRQKKYGSTEVVFLRSNTGFPDTDTHVPTAS